MTQSNTKNMPLLLMPAIVLAGLLGCSDTDSSPSVSKEGQEEVVLGDIEIRVVVPSGNTMMDVEIDFSREGKEYHFENVEGDDEILVQVEGVQIPPDFTVKWRIPQSDGEYWRGQTNWYWYGTYRSEEWDMEKTKFTIEFNADLNATSGYQE